MSDYKPEPEKWTQGRTTGIIYASDSLDDILVDLFHREHGREIAAFILRACQSHGDMLETLKDLEKEFKEWGNDKEYRVLSKIQDTIAKAEGRK